MLQRTLVSTAYGATLPLRLALALRVARAIGERAQSSRLVKASRRGARAMTRSSRSILTSCRARRWIGRAAIGFGGGPGAADLNHGVARACRAVAADEAAFRRKQDVWREAEQMRRLAAQQLAGD
ncbi:argininosuccinate lyase domain protein [Burkholderia thailandensis MSMB121]|nr:argininosuccinate lyase domain protein [Burkholderia thailandensis MSMB121]KST73909.1 hypothetical protein WS76_06850 [Burkholderia humptydooensis]